MPDDNDNESEYVNLVNVITPNGKHYYANEYNGEIYDLDIKKHDDRFRYSERATCYWAYLMY